MNSSNRATKEDIIKWIEPALEKHNFHDYTVSVSGSTEKGDGYLGDITFVDVATNNGDQKLNFVIKSGKKSDQLREIVPVRSAFENEIYFYKLIFPIFIKFQEEKGIQEPFNNAPKCYDTLIFEDMEVLILENMKMSGYFLHDRTKPMSFDHIKTVVRTYGKLHAISFALRDQKPEIFQQLASKLVDILKLSSEMTEQPQEVIMFDDVIDLSKKRQDLELTEKLLLFKEEVKSINDITDPSDPYAVILHGDCWNNNFMFKYEDEQRTKPSRVCLLDFQISRLASPAYDLSYFLFTCISQDDLKKFDVVIDTYYESFSTFLRKLGSDPDKMFPFEEVKNQLRRFSKFGLMMMPPLVRVCLSDKDEVIDLAEIADSGRDLMEASSYAVRRIDEYESRTLPAFRLAMEKQFL